MKEQFHQGHRLEVSDLRRLNFIRNDEIGRATASKLIRDPKQTGVSGYLGKRNVEDGVLNQISRQTANNIEDSSYIFQSLPDTKIAMEIWTSCLLSPKDGMTESLVWSINNSNTEYSAELLGELLNVVRDYFEEEYNLVEIVKPAIEDALFKTGSYPLVVIPESTIDDIVNGKSAVSNENLVNAFYTKKDGEYQVEGIGILGDVTKGKTAKVGLENFIQNSTASSHGLPKSIHKNLTVTDNPDILKFHIAVQQQKALQQQNAIRSRYSIERHAEVNLNDDTEVSKGSHVAKRDLSKATPEEKKNRFDTKALTSIVQTLYKDRAYSNQPISILKSSRDASRVGVGHPLVLHIPSSAIIPIHVPGNPRDIVGAFIILDEYGNPLDTSDTSDLFDDSKASNQEKVKGATAIIKSMNFYKEGCTNGINAKNDREVLNELARTYGSLVEEDLLTRLANGLNGENVKLSRVEEVWRIMLARALSAQRTQILYCPEELLTYFAFDYNKYGIGKSLLEDGRILAALRSTLMYADIHSSIQNAIGRRKMTITPNELDPNPMKTMETVRSEFIRANSWNMPLMSQGPVDAINILRESNIDTVIQGDHPAIPTTEIEVEEVSLNRPQIDDALNEKIRNMHVSSLELPATIVDETQSSQFATQSLTAHALFNKRVLTKQRIISNDLLYDHVRKYTLNSGTLIKRLSFKIKEFKNLLTDKQKALGNTLPIIEEFLGRLSVELPAPDNMRIEDQNNDISRQKGLIDTIIDATIPDDVLAMALPEDINDKATLIKEMIKSVLISQYIDANGYLPELSKIIDIDNTDDTIVAALKSFVDPISKLAVDSILTFDRIRKENDDSSLKGALPEDSDSFSGDSSGDSGSGDEFGGGDEFSMGDDLSMGSELNDPMSEETGEEETNTNQDDLIPE